MSDPIRVLWVGKGKNGLPVVDYLSTDPRIRVVGIVAGSDNEDAELKLTGYNDRVRVFNDLERALRVTQPDVVGDMTNFEVAPGIIATALAWDCDVVTGTSNISPEKFQELSRLAAMNRCLFYIPSAAVAMVALTEAVKLIAGYMPSAEVIDLHRWEKADAPSGVNVETCRAIASSRNEAPRPPVEEKVTFDGARGAKIEEVRSHAVRLPGYLAEQLVAFGASGQHLEIRYTVISPSAYGPGFADAICATQDFTGFVSGLESIYMAREKRQRTPEFREFEDG